jgi:hypothetical protein
MRFIGNAPVDGEVRAIASGALATGDTVVVNSDGTVSVVEETNFTQAVGIFEAFESDRISRTTTAYDVNSQKIVVAYTDVNNSGHGTAVVGTVSGTSISFGTPVVFESGNTVRLSSTYDASAGKVVVIYNESNDGFAIVGTVSGTSISFGTRVLFDTTDPINLSSTYDTNAQKIVICYEDGGNTDKGTAIVGTVSGTSISFGSPVIYNNADTTVQSIAYDASAQKVVIGYHDNGNSSYGTAIVGTVSGTSISFGSPVVFNSAATNSINIAYDASAQKVVIAYYTGTGTEGLAIVGTVSGTSISFGTAVAFNTGGVANYNSIVYHAAAQKVVIAYSDLGNSNYGTAIAGTVSGTSISFGSKLVVESGRVNFVSAAYDPDEEVVVISYENVGNSEYGTSVVFRPAYSTTNLTSENFVGFANSGYADGQSAALNSTCSVDKNQSGLTAGETYYVQADGTLGTTPADPSVVAGTAISSNSIIVKG